LQIKLEIIKYRQIITGIISAVILFFLMIFIFFSALRSSSIFEKLLYDTNNIEIDILTLCDVNIYDGTQMMDKIYAENLLDMLDKGILQYKMTLSDQGSKAVDSFYNLIKNKLNDSTEHIVFTNREYFETRQSIKSIRSYILESSRDQKRALSILFILLLLVVAFLIVLSIAATVKIDKEKRKHQYQIELTKNIMESETRIHNLLSSELHDDIGQMLVFLKLKLIESKSPLSSDIDPIIDSVRNLSHNLKIPEFPRETLTASVENLISQFSTISSIGVEYTLSDFHNELYPDYYQIIIFRLIQECLQNAVKHSNAKNIRINLVESAPYLIFRYKDDGIGIDTTDNPVGLKSIEDRVKLLNAELNIDTKIDKGLYIVVKIPFVKEID